MAETLGPVVAVDAGGFSGGIEGVGLLESIDEPAGPMVGDGATPARPAGSAGSAPIDGAAAEAMRRVIVDAARRRRALKRGGRLGRHEISSLGLAAPDLDGEVLFVHDALDVLAREDAIAAEVFRLRYFGGLTVTEMAEKIGMPRRSVDRRLAFAKAWLACRWDDETPEPPREARRHGEA